MKWERDKWGEKKSKDERGVRGERRRGEERIGRAGGEVAMARHLLHVCLMERGPFEHSLEGTIWH